MERTNVTQVFAFVVGVVYLAVGVVGFAVTGFQGVVTNGNEALLGFDLNIFHNIVHIAIGLGFLVVSRMDAVITQGVVIGGGLVYLLAAGLGFLNQLQILSIDSAVAPDNFLHLVSGSAAVLAGLIGARQTDEFFSNRRRAREA
ncbi:MAG: DUF4383 domain-containing protein [Thermoleophilaceae bacterium]